MKKKTEDMPHACAFGLSITPSHVLHNFAMAQLDVWSRVMFEANASSDLFLPCFVQVCSELRCLVGWVLP